MAKHIHIHLAPTRTADRKAKDASRRYNVEIRLPDGSKKVEKLEFPAGKEGGYGGVIKYEIQKRYPGASVLGIIERGDSMKDAGFGIDDIAIGGTVIYKDGGSFKKAKAASKSGMRVKLDNGKEIHVGDVVSTDASDWAKYQAKDAGFDRREYSPREWNRLQDKIKEVESKIKATKEPIPKRELEQVLAKLKAEQGKYRTDDDQAALRSELQRLESRVNNFTSTAPLRLKVEAVKHIKEIQKLLGEPARDAANFVVRNTGPDIWRVFENGKAASVSGPFKTSAEASSWIKAHKATKDAERIAYNVRPDGGSSFNTIATSESEAIAKVKRGLKITTSRNKSYKWAAKAPDGSGVYLEGPEASSPAEALQKIRITVESLGPANQYQRDAFK